MALVRGGVMWGFEGWGWIWADLGLWRGVGR